MDATVLIVDDEKDVREALANVLGYRALLAADGVEAFELYKRHMPDLVLLDLNMPRRNGRATFELLTSTCERSIRYSRTAASLADRGRG